MLRVWPRFASTVLLVVCGRVGAQEPESAAPTPARTEPSQSPAALVREGNALFNEQAFEDALGKYDLAKQALPDSPELAFNRGLTQYRLGRLNEAGGALNQAVLSADREVEALSKFLLGNVQHTRGVQARQQDPQRAIEALQQATRYYFDALDLQPDNDDLRANVELAQKLIKLIQEQEQQQQKQQQQDEQQSEEQEQGQQEQRSQDDEEQEEQQQAGAQEEQQEQDEAQEQQGEQEQEPQDEQQQAGQQGEQQEQDRQQLQQAQGEQQDEEKQARQMSAEQAERMFQQIRDKEHRRRLQKARREWRKAQPVKRDW